MFFATDRNVIDDTTLPTIMNCGINLPSPDRITPKRAGRSVWSWAPGEPKAFPTNSVRAIVMNATDGLWRASQSFENAPIACRMVRQDHQNSLKS